ncbi:glutamate 5-kinase [Thalassotalea ponticola]|uniref:glutamate 5-kinase n=1 Tax=Thalassotalea ponticola TaxID=1523392 RepID=UPI0025B2EE3E|nr:glutamate 5-kinase [Thalassotalea ponticola]MDN3652479.1 glutamate 5-kinase [Thalassotalea ponticola]
MKIKRVVVKVGSALIAPQGQQDSHSAMLEIAQFINQLVEQNTAVVLVSSGAVATGKEHIAHGSANPSIIAKQAMASIGQTRLMSKWQSLLTPVCSQLLITHGDIKDRRRYINIKNTLRLLLANHVLPIVNENDTVATEELKVGDNDNLAALVAVLCDADALLILSDVNGVYDADPRDNAQAALIPRIEVIDDRIRAMACGTRNNIATGGMQTKIEAAQKACDNGIDTFICGGNDIRALQAFLRGENPGSHFVAQKTRQKAKKHWLKYSHKSNASIEVDSGAAQALGKDGASLLASGIVRVTGHFSKGEVVAVQGCDDAHLLAKGAVQYSSDELQRIKGKNSRQIAQLLGYCPSTEVIHRDDLVLLNADN